MLAQQVLKQHEIYVPEDFGQQEFYNQTTLHPFGIVAVVSLGVWMLLAPRRHALLPMLVMACFVSPAQRIVLAGLDFDMLRLMVLFGMTRVIGRGEAVGLRWNALDTTMVAWTIVSSIAYVVQIGTFGAVINRLGGSYDALGMYFLFRCLVRDLNDLDRCIGYFLWIAVPVFLLFLVERVTQRNPFAFLGGVPEITRMREGRLRCQGPFQHPILAGCFWAAIFAVVAARWWKPGVNRVMLMVPLCAIGGIVYLCASSTPLLGLILGCMAWAAWTVRDLMRPIRWATLLGLIGLHMIMTKPVWHLLARASVVGGSTGWHRYALIDRAIQHVGEWWLFGTRSTAHWGRQMFDITNQYVREGVKGGLLALILFVTLMSLAYGGAGRLRKATARLRYAPRLAWGLGAAIFAHMAMFLAISITYSQQNLLVWLFVLAAVGSLAPATRAARVRVPRRAATSAAPAPG